MPKVAPADGSRAQRAAAHLGLALVSTLGFLAAIEGGLRLYDRLVKDAPMASPDPMRDLYVEHPYLPAVLRPSTEYRDADTAGHINSLGLRGPERPARKPAGTWRIVCVGGSTTFGAGIVGDENTWPAKLEAALSEAFPHRSIEVLNAGIPGYTTAENVIYLSLRLIDLQPDLVVLYEGYNDFKPNRHPGFVSDYSHWRDRGAPPERPWGEGSRLVSRLRTALAGFGPRPGDAVRDRRTGAELPRHDTVSAEGLAAFQRNLETMIAVSRQAGARVAMVTMAHPCTRENLDRSPGLFSYLPQYVPGLTFDGVREAFDRHNAVVRQVAQEQRVLLVDAASRVPPDPSFFVDHVHFNAAGAAVFAEVVAAPIVTDYSLDLASKRIYVKRHLPSVVSIPAP